MVCCHHVTLTPPMLTQTRLLAPLMWIHVLNTVVAFASPCRPVVAPDALANDT